MFKKVSNKELRKSVFLINSNQKSKNWISYNLWYDFNNKIWPHFNYKI